MIIIDKSFVFDSAHWLPKVSKDHKCRNLHGHTYHLKLLFKGEIDEESGWLQDFGEIKKVVQPVLEKVDHKLINDVKGLENPTCELFCIWWYNELKPLLPNLYSVELKETPTSGAIYTPI